MASNLFDLDDADLQLLGDDETISGVLQNFGNELQEALRRSLDTAVHGITPKNLYQSIVFDIQFLGSAYKFEMLMEDYWEFIDLGVQGVGGVKADGTAWAVKNTNSPFSYKDKKPPISAIKDWSTFNGYNPFALRESIFRQGKRATNFFSNVVNEDLIAGLVKKLEKAGAREVEISLKNTIDGIST
jgi:hypothetical protein